MNEQLKPCPFQKPCETHDVRLVEQKPGYGQIGCADCGLWFPSESLMPLDELIGRWNTRAERTCTMTKLEPPLLLEGWWSCSECGPVFPPCNDEIAVWVLQQCPHCGAKVVE